MEFLKRRFFVDGRFRLAFAFWFFIAIFGLVAFIATLDGILDKGIIVTVDLNILRLFAALRDPANAAGFLALTYLGSWQIIIPLGVAVLALFALFRRWRMALFLITSYAGGELISSVLKALIRRPRPGAEFALLAQDTYSFPSGHAIAAFTFYGMLGYFIYRMVRRRSLKTLTAVLTIALVAAIGVSRVYLGVHWPSDVLAGWAIGLAFVGFLIALYEEREIVKPKQSRPAVVSETAVIAIILILFAANGLYFYQYYRAHPIQVPPSVETALIPVQNLTAFIESDSFPKFNESLTGERVNPVSIIITGSQETLTDAFKAAGWYVADTAKPATYYRFLKAELSGTPYPTAPVTPALMNGEPETIAFEKPTAKNTVNERHHTRFWKTGFTWQSKPIWAGTASYDRDLRYIVAHSISPDIDAERDYIREQLVGTSRVANVSELQLIPPQTGKNNAGDTFVTDGKAYVFTLAN
jgi:membrane-associated phospholipid phosphatase